MIIRYFVQTQFGLFRGNPPFILSFLILSTPFLLGKNREELDPITIIATRSEKTTSSTAGMDSVITDEDLMRSGALSLEEAFKYEPGVSIPFDFTGADPLVPYLGSGEKGINIRGMEGNRILLNIDGIRQPPEFFTAGGMAGAGRVYFDPATLSQIELFKSSSSSLYGSDAMGGSINVRTVGPESLLGSSLLGKSFEDSLTLASVNQSINNRLVFASGSGGFAYSLVYSFREGGERINNGSVSPDPQQFQGNAAVFKMVKRLSLGKFKAVVDIFEQNSITDVNSIETGNNLSILHDSRRKRNRISIEFDTAKDWTFPMMNSLSAKVYLQDSQQDTINLQDRLNPSLLRRRDISFATKIQGLEAVVDKDFNYGLTNHNITYGLEWSESDIESGYLKTDLLQDGSSILDNQNSMAPSKSSNFALFFIDEIQVKEYENWAITPSIRFDYYKIEPEEDENFLANSASVAFTPSKYENKTLSSLGLSVIYNWNEQMNLYFSYNHGIRNPSAEELNGFFEHPPTTSTTSSFIIDANPDLEEEKSDSFEIGLQETFDSGSWEFSLFKNYYDGFIDLVKQPSLGVVDLYTNDNIGSVEIYGIEFKFDTKHHSFFSSSTPLDLGFSTSWSKGTKTNESVPLNSIEPWKSVFYLGYTCRDEDWGSRLTSTYRAGKDDRDIAKTSGEPIPIGDSLVLDLVGWKKISENWSLRAGINNITNEKYFLWSSARRGGGHSIGSADEKNTQPGTNAFISFAAKF